MRKRVYLAGPISLGNLSDNVNKATSAFIELTEAGFAPFCPHWSVYSGGCEPLAMTDYNNRIVASSESMCVSYGSAQPNSLTHEQWLEVDEAWVMVADAVLRLPGASKGADREVAYAQRLGIPVFHSIEEVIEWGKDKFCHAQVSPAVAE